MKKCNISTVFITVNSSLLLFSIAVSPDTPSSSSSSKSSSLSLSAGLRLLPPEADCFPNTSLTSGVSVASPTNFLAIDDDVRDGKWL